MHDNDRILENRINRELIERILPAESLRRVPLAVEANVLAGEPVGVPGAGVEDAATEQLRLAGHTQLPSAHAGRQQHRRRGHAVQ